MEEKRFFINEKRQAGGFDYTTYTWPEVLEYFEAPDFIEDIGELKRWVENETGMAFQYLVTEGLEKRC